MIPVTVTPGENDNDNNFVEENLASLGNYVWEDKNANGSQDAGEIGIPNVLVRLFNSAGIQISTTFTDNTGFYQFSNLVPGTYMVKFDKPIGYEATTKDRVADGLDSDADVVTGLTANITLSGGDNNQTIDAGYYKLARLGDLVWEDQNANGVQDALEPGIANVTVTLTGTDGLGRAVNMTTTTNNNGLYEFTNLVPGSYTVTFTKPTALYKPSPSNTPGDDARDSDASTVTGQSGAVTLVSGDNNQTVDAGFYRCATVGDYVFLDVNKNNLQDATDQGLNGILVELYKSSNPTTPVQTMLTINNPSDPTKKGYYTFEVCELGNYFIKVKPDMTIYNWTQPNQGVNDGIDSDIIDFEKQSTLIFTVSYGAQITDVDAGVQLKPLPVTLVSFSGRWNETREVNELYWETATETNNDYFEVERSFRGSKYEVVGKVKGQGNSSGKVNYDLDDEDIAKNGVYTYRLKQVDFDGRFTYTSPIEIRVERKGGVSTSIYPNPSVGKVNVEITVGEGIKVVADLYDNTGRLVQAKVINGVSEGEEMSAVIDGSILSKGVYYIMVQVDGETSAHKLIILE